MLKYLTIFLSMITVSVFASTKPIKLILDKAYLVSENANSGIIVKYQDNQKSRKTKYLSGYAIQDYTEIFPDLEQILNSPKHQKSYIINDVSEHENGRLGFMISEDTTSYNYILQVTNGILESKKFQLGDLQCVSQKNNTVTCSV